MNFSTWWLAIIVLLAFLAGLFLGYREPVAFCICAIACCILLIIFEWRNSKNEIIEINDEE